MWREGSIWCLEGIPGTYSTTRQIQAGAQWVLSGCSVGAHHDSAPALPLSSLKDSVPVCFLFYFRQGLAVASTILELTEIHLVLLPKY